MSEMSWVERREALTLLPREPWRRNHVAVTVAAAIAAAPAAERQA